jgi:D-serine deaminase-like pyridoxal phosphate-dependent protein
LQEIEEWQRLVELRRKYPEVFIASLIDCKEMAEYHTKVFSGYQMVADVFIDVNNGMNRSGHPFDDTLLAFYQYLQQQPHLKCLGLHVYDGHVRDADFEKREHKIEAGFEQVAHLLTAIEENGGAPPLIIAGGTPSFTTHIKNTEVLCSPGTCVFWDWGYGNTLSEQPFVYAALLLTRVISKPSEGLVAIDLGHKAVAAENPIDKRVQLFNAPDYELLSQSEEHGVLRVSDEDWEKVKVGDVFYGVPYHICPTVNLYEEAQVVENRKVTETWQVLARRRKITV